MKIDRTKLKKSNSEVPADCGWLIEKLQTCSDTELLKVLQGFSSWGYGKCELYHWTHVLDRFDGILEKAATPEPTTTWVLQCDLVDNAELEELVVWVLHFTTLLVEHSFSRHLYSSVDHLISLLSSSSMTIVLSVLNLLYMFSKRSNFISRLPAGPRQALLSRLMHLAESWGGKENGFDLAHCCRDLPLERYPDSATTLHFEACAPGTLPAPLEVPASGTKASYQPTIPVCIPNVHLQAQKKSPSHIMEELVKTYPIPEDKRMGVFTHLRLACNFAHYETRLQCVQARLQSLSVLVYCNTLQDNLNTLLYSGLLDEFVAVLEIKDPMLTEIKAATLRTLTSIIHLDRVPNFPKLSTIMDVTGASSYHGFLPVLVRSCITSLTSSKDSPSSSATEVEHFPAPLATALFSFLYHLASYEHGGEALVACGMMEALLSVVNWKTIEPDHITFVTRAVRVIDLITNLDMHPFQVHGGLQAFVNRLELEVNQCRKEQPFVIVPPSHAAAESDSQFDLAPMETDMTESDAGGHSAASTSSTVSPPDASTLNLGNDDREGSSDSNPESVPDPASVTATASTSKDKKPSQYVKPDYSAAKTNLSCLAQRAALIKSMLNFLKKAIQDPTFADSMRHLMDASLPTSLKHIISNAEYYGSSLFLLATDVVTVYVFGEPSFLSSLQDNGLTDVVLHALLVKDVPATREVLSSLPNVFSALCLNTRGLESFVACKPFESLLKVLLSPDYLLAMRRRRSADPMGDTASNLGNAMDELMRHQPSLKTDAMKAIVLLLKELVHMGTDSSFVCWKTPAKHDPPPIPALQALEIEPHNNNNSSDDEEYEEEEREVGGEEGSSTSNLSSSRSLPSADADPQAAQTNEVSDLSEQSKGVSIVPVNSPLSDSTTSTCVTAGGTKKPVPLVDYILNVMKFVDSILSNNSTDDHCKEFVQQKGLIPLLDILGLANLPMDFPSSQACQSVGAVCKSVLNLSSESNVIKIALQNLNKQLANLSPFLEQSCWSNGDSLLLQEVSKAMTASGGSATLNTTNDPFLNPQLTPFLHVLIAVHGYIAMLVHVCRTSQTEIRQISVSEWGGEQGLKVIDGLASLYQVLVWEATILVSKNAEAEEKPTETGETAMEVDSNSAAAGTSAEVKTPTTSKNEVNSASQLSKVTKQLLSYTSRLGKTLAELFTLLGKLCVGSPLRQRRGQTLPPNPFTPNQASRAMAESLAKLLQSLMESSCPASGSLALMTDSKQFTEQQETYIARLHLTSMICSARFCIPMLFDERKMPYHLLMHYFVHCHGLSALFSSYEWALEKFNEECKEDIPKKLGDKDSVASGLVEYLENWCSLLDRLLNPKNIFESPHAVTFKPSYTLMPLQFLIHIQKLGFDAMLKLWNQSCITKYSLQISDCLLSVLCSILKAEKVIEEKLKEKPLSPSATSSSSVMMMVAAPPTTSAAALASTVSTHSSDITSVPTANVDQSNSSGGASAQPAQQDNAPSGSAATAPPTAQESTPAVAPAGAPDAPAGAPEVTGAPPSVAAAAGTPTPAVGALPPNNDDEDEESAEPEVNRLYLQALVDMGFPEERCIQAINQTNSVEQATEFLLMGSSADFIPPDILGDMSADGDHAHMFSEDAQMMQAIEMSLNAHASTSIIPTSATNALLTASASTDEAGPSTAGASGSSGTAERRTPAKLWKIGGSTKKEGNVEIDDKPMKKAKLNNFMDGVLEGSLRLLDNQPETVHKVCELLSTCGRRRGNDWMHNMLDTIISEVSSLCTELGKIAEGAYFSAEEIPKLCSSPLSTKFNTRLHILTLLLNEINICYKNDSLLDDLTQKLTQLLSNTNRALTAHSQYLKKSSCSSNTSTPTAAAAATTATSAPGGGGLFTDEGMTLQSSASNASSFVARVAPATTASASVSSLLLPLNLTTSDGGTNTTGTAPDKPSDEAQDNVAPRWIASTALLIDLYERVFLCSKRRMKLLKSRKRVWKCFDTGSQKWIPYAGANNKIIDEAYMSGQGSTRIVNARRKYLIQFSQLVQINEESGNRRPIMMCWDDDVTEVKPLETSQSQAGAVITPEEAPSSEASSAQQGVSTESGAAAAVSTPTAQDAPVLMEDVEESITTAQSTAEPPQEQQATEVEDSSVHPEKSPVEDDGNKENKSQEEMEIEGNDDTPLTERLPDYICNDLLEACTGLLSVPLDKNSLHAVMRLCLRLTSTWERASAFASMGGVKALLKLSNSSAFSGFTNLAALLIRHVLEEPDTLKHAMEKVIKGTVSTAQNSNSSTGRELNYLLRLLAPVACRDHAMFTKLCLDLIKVDSVKRPAILHQPNSSSEDVLICNLTPSTNSKTSTGSTTTSPSQVAQQVICDLLDALAYPQDEESTSTPPISPAVDVDKSCCDLPSSGAGGSSSTSQNARRCLNLSRSSSANDMVVQDNDDQSPMESDTSKGIESAPTKTATASSSPKGRKPLLSRWEICKLLAEFIKCYPDFGKMVTEHVYSPNYLEHITQECTALSYMLDFALAGSNTSSASTTEDSRGYVKLLVAAISSCNQSPDAQSSLVSEIKAAFARTCQTSESETKHNHLLFLMSLISIMIESCPPHYSNTSSMFSKNTAVMNNMMKILVRKGVVTDLARLPHYLDLSSPHLATTINASLKTLEMVARVMNHPNVVSTSTRKKQTSSSGANADQNRTENNDTAGGDADGNRQENAGGEEGRNSASGAEGTTTATQDRNDEDDNRMEEDELEVEEHNERAEENIGNATANDLDSFISRIMRDGEMEQHGNGGNDQNSLATLAIVIRDDDDDDDDDDDVTLHDSRMVTHSDSQMEDYLNDTEAGNEDGAGGADDDDDSSSSSGSDDDSDSDDDDDDDDDAENDENEDVVEDEENDGDDDMDDGSVIDEEEEMEEDDEEEEIEEEEEVELYENNYLRIAGDRDGEDMVLLPSYQHYVDTIETIDTMIFGNRLTGGQSALSDDQTLLNLAAPGSVNAPGGSNSSSAIPPHPLFQNSRSSGATGTGAAGTAGATGSSGVAGRIGANNRGARTRGVLRLLGRNPTEILELSSSLRDATQVWFTNSDPVYNPSTPTSHTRWTEESRVLHLDPVHETIMLVRAPLMAAMEKRQAEEQAEKDRKKKEQEENMARTDADKAKDSSILSFYVSGSLNNPLSGGFRSPSAAPNDPDDDDDPDDDEEDDYDDDEDDEDRMSMVPPTSSASSGVPAPPPTAAAADTDATSPVRPTNRWSVTTSGWSLAPQSPENLSVANNSAATTTAQGNPSAETETVPQSTESAVPQGDPSTESPSASAAIPSLQEGFRPGASLSRRRRLAIDEESMSMSPSVSPPLPPPVTEGTVATPQPLSDALASLIEDAALSSLAAASSVPPAPAAHAEITTELTAPPPQSAADVSAGVEQPQAPVNEDGANSATDNVLSEASNTGTEGPAAASSSTTAEASEGSAEVSNTASASTIGVEAGAAPAPVASSSGIGPINARDTEYAHILGDIIIPEGVDPSFLAALPEEMRQEVIAEHMRLQRLTTRNTDASSSSTTAAAAAPPTGEIEEVNPEFLAALPPNIQEEVLAQQRVQQQQAAAARSNPDEPVDPAQFLDTLPASLRQTILTDLDNSQFSALPPDLAEEAQILRRQRDDRVRHANDQIFQSGGGRGRGHTLSHILRNTARLNTRLMQSNSWSTSWNLQPSSSHSQVSGCKTRGRQLLDHESLTCLIVLLFLDEAKLNTTRLHKVLRYLCNHPPTRQWVVKTLLSILEKCKEQQQTQHQLLPDTPSTSRLHPPSIETPKQCHTPDTSRGAIRKGSKMTSTPVTVPPSTPASSTPSSVDLKQSSNPAWLSMSIDAALGCRANIFQIQRPQQSGKKFSSVANSTVMIHPQASQLVCKHVLEALIVLAKNFTVQFLPYRKKTEDSSNKSDARKSEESSSSNNKDEGAAGSSGTSKSTKQGDSTDFWDLLVKLDSINICKKGKGLARSHSCSGSSNVEDEPDNLPLESSPLGLLIEQLAHPVVRRSSLLTDKLLKLLAIVCSGLSSPSSSSSTNNSNQPKNVHTPENLAAMERLFGMAIQVLTSKSCSEEGLEDATQIMVHLSECPPPARSMVIKLLLQGAATLGITVEEHIQDLLTDLREHVRKTGTAAGEAPASKGSLKDRFTHEEVVIVGRNNSQRHKPAASGTELQLKSIPALTNKTSSQAFFLRTLKVIVQLRDASALLKAKRARRSAASANLERSGFVRIDNVSAVVDAFEQSLAVAVADLSNPTAAAAPAPAEEQQQPSADQQPQPTSSNTEGNSTSEQESAAPVERMDDTPSNAPPQQEDAPPQQEASEGRHCSETEVERAIAATAAAFTKPSGESSPTEAMDVDDTTKTNDDLTIKSLSAELNLDELWQTLSACLDELAETSDTHAVLVLQPAVEAFFLVHASAASTSSNDGATSGSRSSRASQQESRESQLSHLNDLAPLSPLPSTSAAAAESTSSDSPKDKKLDVSETFTDAEKFLKFAERHRSVLNQILRQSTVHLADGPFSVLVDHIRLLDFDIKRKYFRTELERADDGSRREDLTVHVRRDHVFEDSFRELHRRSSDEWKNRFYIVFEGEEGQDAGGLLREWYMIISREIFNPMYALFCISPGDRVTYMINSSSHCNSNHLSYFKFVGRVIAKAVYDNKLLECYFTRSFYKHILGKMVRFTDMESEDYSFYQGLVYLMDHDVSTLGYELTFSTEVQEFGVTEVRELKPGGEKIPVTEENKLEYVKLVCQMKMTGAIRQQLNSFLEGFYDIIPKRLISIFSEQELELLISGLPNIDIDDLRANTEYHKYQPNSLQIQWFWRALRGFDQADRAKFLQFVTGTSKVPLQGFSALEGMNGIQKFQIHRDDRATDRLPSAHTCFNQLDLPVYETYDKLRHYLLKAVHECSEGFGFA